MASGVVAASSKRVVPPQRTQVTTSSWKTWRSSQAHGFFRGSGARTVLSCSKSARCFGQFLPEVMAERATQAAPHEAESQQTSRSLGRESDLSHPSTP